MADVIKISDPTRSTKQRTSLSPVVRERHVVVCGSISAGNLKARLQELFHADHGKHNVRWVKVGVCFCVCVYLLNCTCPRYPALSSSSNATRIGPRKGGSMILFTITSAQTRQRGQTLSLYSSCVCVYVFVCIY